MFIPKNSGPLIMQCTALFVYSEHLQNSAKDLVDILKAVKKFAKFLEIEKICFAKVSKRMEYNFSWYGVLHYYINVVVIFKERKKL